MDDFRDGVVLGLVLHTGKDVLLKGRLSTVDLLKLTILDQLIF
jgi:hypothetical protein